MINSKIANKRLNKQYLCREEFSIHSLAFTIFLLPSPAHPPYLSLALSSALLWACLFHLLWLFHPLASLLRLTFHASLCMCERLFCPYIYCIRFWFRLITNWHEVIVCYCTIYILCAKQINPSNAVWLHLLIVGNIKCIEI